jgi:hypothetical protein
MLWGAVGIADEHEGDTDEANVATPVEMFACKYNEGKGVRLTWTRQQRSGMPGLIRMGSTIILRGLWCLIIPAPIRIST